MLSKVPNLKKDTLDKHEYIGKRKRSFVASPGIWTQAVMTEL